MDKMINKEVVNSGIEKYYMYIIEQLEYVEMITSTFDVRRKINPIISVEVAQKCKQLADKIKKNLEGI